MTDKDLLRMALEALQYHREQTRPIHQSNEAIEALRARLAQPEAEPVAWQGAEEWESLAWELCADENGEDACNELIWEGGPVPEPWGDHWLKYEGEAKRLIALVRKHIATPQAVPAPAPVVPADMVMVPRSLLARLVKEALTFEPSIVDREAISQARAIIAAAPAVPAPAVPLTDDMVEKEFVSRGDGRGQGLHPYWKSAFREGWHFARAMIAASPPAPAVAEPLSDERIDEIFEGAHENMPKGVLFRTFIARAIEQAHGIGTQGGEHV